MITPAWKARLVPASFRGVEFKIDVGSRSGGRRTVEHEFPKRDDPYAEDMGRSARRFTVAGYVIGGDYYDQRDALIDALESEGSGTLVHPSMGEFQVNPGPFAVTEHRERARIAEFEMSFVEAGSNSDASPASDTQASVDNTANQSDAATGATANAALAGGSPAAPSGALGGGIGSDSRFGTFISSSTPTGTSGIGRN